MNSGAVARLVAWYPPSRPLTGSGDRWLVAWFSPSHPLTGSGDRWFRLILRHTVLELSLFSGFNIREMWCLFANSKLGVRQLIRLANCRVSSSDNAISTFWAYWALNAVPVTSSKQVAMLQSQQGLFNCYDRNIIILFIFYLFSQPFVRDVLSHHVSVNHLLEMY